MRPERSLWTRLGDSTLHKCPFKAQEEVLRFTVNTSRLYSVNVKLHWGAGWTTLPWCYKKPTQPISTSPTPALFMFHRFLLIQEFLFKLYRRDSPVDKPEKSQVPFFVYSNRKKHNTIVESLYWTHFGAHSSDTVASGCYFIFCCMVLAIDALHWLVAAKRS